MIGRFGASRVNELLPAGQRYLANASSLNLAAAFGAEHSLAGLEAVLTVSFRTLVELTLGGPAVWDLDQAWLRRQYALKDYPPRHAPHTWHQDGALGFDFAAPGANEPGPDALLPMVTCWLPLNPCGRDAPGLELIARRVTRLLPVIALRDEYLRATFPLEAFWRPVLKPGDALLFEGGTLHRTFVTPEMASDRTSIEFRFFRADGIPARLAGDRFIPLG